MPVNLNRMPTFEARVATSEVVADLGAMALDVEGYVSPQAILEVPAEVVTLGAVAGFPTEQTGGYKSVG